jgi:hypothetical protein
MAGKDWSDEEIKATVVDYFSMFEKELKHVAYNKAEHNRNLRKVLSNRSKASIELKHANIRRRSDAPTGHDAVQVN